MRSTPLSEASDITLLLHAASTGDRDANARLFDTVYRELRAIARSHRRRWNGNDTLGTTALIHEAYVRLAKSDLASYTDRSHFFATASRAMRQVLINYAERLRTARRGGDAVKVTLTDLAAPDEMTFDDLLQIDQLLEQLEATNERHCRLFECRVFGGMTIEETAAALGISPATVKRDWALLSAWVFRELQKASAG